MLGMKSMIMLLRMMRINKFKKMRLLKLPRMLQKPLRLLQQQQKLVKKQSSIHSMVLFTKMMALAGIRAMVFRSVESTNISKPIEECLRMKTQILNRNKKREKLRTPRINLFLFHKNSNQKNGMLKSRKVSVAHSMMVKERDFSLTEHQSEEPIMAALSCVI